MDLSEIEEVQKALQALAIPKQKKIGRNLDFF